MPLMLPVQRRVFIESTQPWRFRFPPVDTWQDKLGQSIESFFRRLLELGLIERIPVDTVIEASFTVSGLKSELRQRGLKVGGRKLDLVKRLIDNDPEWARSLHAADDRFVRTPAGQALAEQIEAEIQREEEALDSKLLVLIKRGDYQQVQAEYLRWCSEWGVNAPDIPADFGARAAKLVHKLPGIVAEHTVLALLTGSWDPEFVVRLTDSRAAAYERDLLHYRQASYAAGIQIEPSPSTECTCAAKHAGCYRLEDAPDYPFGDCDNYPETGCICFWTIVFRNDPVGEWKVPARRHPKAGGYIERPPPPLTMGNLRAVGNMLGASEENIQVAARNAGLAAHTPSAVALTTERPGILSRVWGWLIRKSLAVQQPLRQAPARQQVVEQHQQSQSDFGAIASTNLINMRGDDHPCPRFSFEQMGTIRRGVMAGRQALLKRGPDPWVFADGFLKAGGFQVPGLDVDAAHLRAVGSFILFAVETGTVDAEEIREAYQWAGDEVARAVLREVVRTHVELVWYVLGRNDKVDGFKVTVSEARDRYACAKIMQCDNFGMGESVYPKHEIMILPPCCDGAIRIEQIYKRLRR